MDKTLISIITTVIITVMIALMTKMLLTFILCLCTGGPRNLSWESPFHDQQEWIQIDCQLERSQEEKWKTGNWVSGCGINKIHYW